MESVKKIVIKRNGKEVEYETDKIRVVLKNCGVKDTQIEELVSIVENKLEMTKDIKYDVEKIQDIIIDVLGECNLIEQQKEYKRYKKERET